eukprot:TRINITY_DN50456_c0_g1_i1.p1 TRINITY_DN50456_c0_g1~~TRINITY_DN50456_c0_g1_i1.p1  ORF type:complete len:245 (+),score=35.73 TRINITY_DN50456_c0_g1_i1:47-736(+)
MALTQQELPKLHQQLSTWLMQSKYQLQPNEYRPIWRAQNTSLTLATGSGVGSYYLMRRHFPKLRFPMDLFAPCVTFYLSYRTSQGFQMYSMYESILNMPSPLGESARNLLGTMRGDETSPLQELAKSRGSVAARDEDRTEEARKLVGGKEGSDVPVDFGNEPSGKDPWASTGADIMGGTAADGLEPSWSGADGFGTVADAQPKPPKRRTWDEIRAEAAQKDAGQAAKQT